MEERWSVGSGGWKADVTLRYRRCYHVLAGMGCGESSGEHPLEMGKLNRPYLARETD